MKININKKVLLLGILFIIWLLVATPVVTAIYNRNVSLHKIEDLPESTFASVYYSIDELEISSNLMNTVTISGWAFLIPENKTDQKTVSLIFKSEKEMYCIDTIAEPDSLWLMTLLQEMGAKTDGGNVFFSTAFSPLAFRNGQYQLFIYCNVENSISGLIETRYFFEKNNESFKTINKTAEELSPQIGKVYEVSNGYGYIDRLEISDKEIYVSGWSFLDGLDSTYQNIYIGIRDINGVEHYFKTVPFIRLDLLGHQNSIQNYNAGFYATILLDNFVPSQESITIYTVQNNKLFTFAYPINAN